MDFRILGPPQVAPGGRELHLGRSREQRVLAARLLRAASALWRGPALAGVPGRLIEQAAGGLNEQRLAVLEECLAHELTLGGGDDLVTELAALVAEHPLRERLRGQLMVALHRA